ncbi:MAG: hypothetical protein ABSD67_19680 [Terracidiphilus sp.]
MSRNPHLPESIAIGDSAIAMVSLLLFGFPISRRRKPTRLALLLIATSIGATIGCSGTKAATPPANPGTTPGSYAVTVTRSSGLIMAATAVIVTVN